MIFWWLYFSGVGMLENRSCYWSGSFFMQSIKRIIICGIAVCAGALCILTNTDMPSLDAMDTKKWYSRPLFIFSVFLAVLVAVGICLYFRIDPVYAIVALGVICITITIGIFVRCRKRWFIQAWRGNAKLFNRDMRKNVVSQNKIAICNCLGRK